jgi:hypothetical protein
MDATNRSLTITNTQMSDLGDYTVVAANSTGSVRSKVAHLDVDPTFTKITTDKVVTQVGTGTACAWGDYDNDGFIDLFVRSAFNPAINTAQRSLLFPNNRDGTFAQITNTVATSEARDWRSCTWVDYDSDGYLDLFATSTDGNGFAAQNELFRNNADGTFTKMTSQTACALVAAAGESEEAVWADYDLHGFVDVSIARYGPDWLFHNQALRADDAGRQ